MGFAGKCVGTDQINDKLTTLLSSFYCDEDKEILQSAKVEIAELLKIGADLSELESEDDFWLGTNFSKFGDILAEHSQKISNPQKLLEFALNHHISDEDEITKTDKLVKLALDKGADLSELDFEVSYYLYHNLAKFGDTITKHSQKISNPKKILELVFGAYEYSEEAIKNQVELIKFALKNGANLKETYEDIFSFYELIFIKGLFDVLDYVAKKLPEENFTLTTVSWFVGILHNFNFEYTRNAIYRFSDSFPKDEIFSLAREHGISIYHLNIIFDLYDLAKDGMDIELDGSNLHFTQKEWEILNLNKLEICPKIDSAIEDVKNSQNFSDLSLALLSKSFDYANVLPKNQSTLFHMNKNGITPIQIYGFINDGYSNKLGNFSKDIVNNVDDFDIQIAFNGETITDILVNDEEMKSDVLNKTQDPLYDFYKEGADLFKPSQEPEKIHIGISMGEGFWSLDAGAVTRFISSKYPDVKFHFVTLDNMQNGGDDFFKQFDGWINPGAGDSYPSGDIPFGLEDWQPNMQLEEAYQLALVKTHEYKIPYIGMCAGNQHLALSHAGKLMKVNSPEKFIGGQIEFVKGTLPYFMAMNAEQQTNALKACDFPEIKFKGNRAHKYAIVEEELGNEIILGAKSGDGVVMSIAHENGLRYSTQFHPEHFYHLDPVVEVNHQKEWLNNFINLARLHKNETIHENAAQTLDLMSDISARLKECLNNPTTVDDLDMFDAWF